jgi:LysM repeat protein
MQIYRRWTEILVVLAVILIVSVSPAAANNDALPPEYDYVGYLLEAINNLRGQYGLLPLSYNAHLEQAAIEQAAWMVANSSYAHHHGGSTPRTRADAAGYSGYDWCCGENTFISINANPQAAFSFWRASSSHYYQMLSKWHTDIGIGYYVSEGYTGQVMVFGQQWANSTAVLGRANPTTSTPTQTTQSQPAAQTVSTTNTTTSGGCALQHVVRPGENLFRISLNNGVPMATVAAANGITDYRMIVVGQALCIPAGGASAGTYVSSSGVGASGSPQDASVGNQVDNWCNPGGPWGDGRCNDPDPYVSEHLWECGYYFAQGITRNGC